MGWVDQKSELELIGKKIDPSVIISTKDSFFWQILATLVAMVTFGGLSRRRFLDDFATTIGPLQGYPASWEYDSVKSTIIHESRHTQQARWFGLGLSPWLGLPFFGLCYLLLPIPLGFAYGRYWFEFDACRFTYRYKLKEGWDPRDILDQADHASSNISSGAYGWAVPKKFATKRYTDMAWAEIKKA
jgi:hypothetical protein